MLQSTYIHSSLVHHVRPDDGLIDKGPKYVVYVLTPYTLYRLIFDTVIAHNGDEPLKDIIQHFAQYVSNLTTSRSSLPASPWVCFGQYDLNIPINSAFNPTTTTCQFTKGLQHVSASTWRPLPLVEE